MQKTTTVNIGVRLSVGIALIVGFAGLVIAQSQTPAPVYLKCGWLLDGKSDQPKKDVMVAIEGEKIREVGNGLPPSSAQVVDLSRETCLPGLIDTHTHILLQGDITAADYELNCSSSLPSTGRFSRR